MADIVNLRRTRKNKARAAKEKHAEQNRVKFGTPKPLKELNAARSEKAGRDLDAHRRDKSEDAD
jgi:hypothetical protein